MQQKQVRGEKPANNNFTLELLRSGRLNNMISDSWQVGRESKYRTVLHLIAVDKIWLCGNNADIRFAVVVVRWFVADLCDFFLFGLAFFFLV